MKRSPIVIAGTAFGLAGLLTYHTASTPSTAATSSSSAAKSASASSTNSMSTKSASSASGAASASSTPTSSTTASTAKRSATGQDVTYQYGNLQLKVTVSGSKITNVSVVKLEVTDPRSQEIDQQAIPELYQETISAGSANIDGVSGASYTSQAYEQSLQSALDKLGITSAAS